MIERIARGLLIVLSMVWMVATAWTLFGQRTDPTTDALHRQQYEQKLNACLGQFAERYECTSTLLRKKSSDLANWWAGQLLLIFGPPLAASAVYAAFANLRERRQESLRNRARRERRDKEAGANRPDEDELPLREIDEIRRRAEERRREAKQRRKARDPSSASEDAGDRPRSHGPPTS